MAKKRQAAPFTPPPNDDYLILRKEHPGLATAMNVALASIETAYASRGEEGWRERVYDATAAFEAAAGPGNAEVAPEAVVEIAGVAMPSARLLPAHLLALGMPVLASDGEALVLAGETARPEATALARDMRERLGQVEPAGVKPASKKACALRIVAREPGIPNAELAKRVGVAPSTVGRWPEVKATRALAAGNLREGWSLAGDAAGVVEAIDPASGRRTSGGRVEPVDVE